MSDYTNMPGFTTAEAIELCFREHCGPSCRIQVVDFPLGARVVIGDPDSWRHVQDALHEANQNLPPTFLLTAVIWRPWYLRAWCWIAALAHLMDGTNE